MLLKPLRLQLSSKTDTFLAIFNNENVANIVCVPLPEPTNIVKPKDRRILYTDKWTNDETDK